MHGHLNGKLRPGARSLERSLSLSSRGRRGIRVSIPNQFTC